MLRAKLLSAINQSAREITVATGTDDGGTDLTVDFTSLAPEAGDQLFIVVLTYSTATTYGISGWTTVGTSNAGAGFPHVTLYRKSAAGGETTITVNRSGYPHIWYTVRCRNLTYTSSAAASDFQNMPDPASVTVSAGDVVIVTGALQDDAVTLTVSSGYTELSSDNYTYVYRINTAIGYKDITSGGTEDPGVFGGGGNDSWATWTIVLS